jgi:hypothetical protein
LVAVLKINFEKHGRGTEKIGKGEFAIQDSNSMTDVDLTGNWEKRFVPGQRVDMSMIFNRLRDSVSGDDDGKCPGCGNRNPSPTSDDGPDIEWSVFY